MWVGQQTWVPGLRDHVLFFVCTGLCEQLRVRRGLGYQRHLMRIRCDCWTISAFDFVVLFYSFLYISLACFWVGIVIGIPHAPISVLPWTAGGMSGF